MSNSRSRIPVAIAGGLLCIPVWAQVTQRVSVNPSGAQANGDSTDFPSASADGRYVAFSSGATNLVPADTNGMFDVFVRDRLNGTTELVSVDSLGIQANDHSGFPSISADGRFVAFYTQAWNLVPGDTNAALDIFVRDRQNGTTERVSVDSGGAQGNGNSVAPSISPDGRYVVFMSGASNLVPGDSNARADVFIRDRQTGTTKLVSVDSSGAQGNGDSHSHLFSISADGRFVAFTSFATNLVPGDTNGFQDVFVRDRLAGTTERVSVGSGGTEGNDSAGFNYSISGDGRFVAFVGFATNLVPGDTNGYEDIFVRDRQGGTTERVSLGSSGAEADNLSYLPCISADGHYVAFTSYATNLVPPYTIGPAEVFLRDRQSGTTEKVSVGSGGAQGDFNSNYCSISSDGRYVAFWSRATNFVPEDTNGRPDIFLRDRLGGTTFTSLCDPGVGGVITCPCSNAPAGTGRGCDNSAATGGAILSASGGAYLSSDSLVFTTTGETPAELSIVVQGSSLVQTGLVFGQGVRCIAGPLERLYVKVAAGGRITAPEFGAGDRQVSARSAALGDPVQAGQSRWYFVYYRDPVVLGGCPATSAFNSTQGGRVDWSF